MFQFCDMLCLCFCLYMFIMHFHLCFKSGPSQCEVVLYIPCNSCTFFLKIMYNFSFNAKKKFDIFCIMSFVYNCFLLFCKLMYRVPKLKIVYSVILVIWQMFFFIFIVIRIISLPLSLKLVYRDMKNCLKTWGLKKGGKADC